MSDELRDSPFFGDRIIRFVESILPLDETRTVPLLPPITGFETKLLENWTLIKDVNARIDESLPALLWEAKDFIPPHTALRILLFSHDKEFFSQAVDIVRYAARSELVISDEEINEIVKDLKSNSGIPAQWLINLHGVEKKVIAAPKKTDDIKLPKDFI